MLPPPYGSACLGAHSYGAGGGLAHQSTVAPCSSSRVRCVLVCSSATNRDMNENALSVELWLGLGLRLGLGLGFC